MANSKSSKADRCSLLLAARAHLFLRLMLVMLLVAGGRSLLADDGGGSPYGERPAGRPAVYAHGRVILDPFGFGYDPEGDAPQDQVEACVRALQDERPAARAWGALTLACDLPDHIGPAVPALTAALRDEDAAVRRFAGRALGAAGPAAAPAVEELERMARSDDEMEALRAHCSLVQIAGEPDGHLTALADALGTDRNEGIRGHAAGLLDELGPLARPALPELVNAAKGEDFYVATRTIRALGRIGQPSDEAVGALLSALEWRAGPVREARARRFTAAKALGGFPSRKEQIVPALLRAVREERRLSVAVVRSLRRLGAEGKEVYEVLQWLLAQPGAHPTEWTERSRARSERREIFTYLLSLQRPPAAFAEHASRWVTEDAFPVETVAFLQKMVARPEACRAAVDGLARATRHEDERVHVKAVRALGHACPSATDGAVDALSRLLAEPDRDVRGAAIRTLGGLGPRARAAAGRLKRLATACRYREAPEIDALMSIGGLSPEVRPDRSGEADEAWRLRFAVTVGDASCVRRVLRGTRDVNALDPWGRTALHIAAGGADPELVRMLLRAGADPALRDADGRMALEVAIARHRDRAGSILAEAAEAEYPRESLGAALTRAAEAGLLRTATALIERGAPTDCRDEWGATPLHRAVSMLLRGDRSQLVGLLLEAGADPNARDVAGYTPLHWLTPGGGEGDLIDLLVAHGADIDARARDGSTPLHVAAREDWPEPARALLRHGADPALRDEDGRTPREVALREGHREMAEFLREHGARD